MHPVWQKHPGLIWSNPEADDSVRIRMVLLRPRFGRILDIVLAFGLRRVRQEWKVLREEASPQALRAEAPVERILTNIEIGQQRAASRH